MKWRSMRGAAVARRFRPARLLRRSRTVAPRDTDGDVLATRGKARRAMKRPIPGPPSGHRPAGPPPPGRRSPSGWHRLLPRSSRMFVLGMRLAVGGLGGGVRAARDGEGILRALGIFGSGLLGLALAIAYVANYRRER